MHKNLYLILCLLAGLHSATWADGMRGVALTPQYKAQCGECHTPFPPSLLPATSWQRITKDLAHHFNVDASIDAQSLAPIEQWLIQNAAAPNSRSGSEPPKDRITLSNWFIRKHHEVEPAVWKRASIKTPANCSACHAGADSGVFNEHDVRIPK